MNSAALKVDLRQEALQARAQLATDEKKALTAALTAHFKTWLQQHTQTQVQPLNNIFLYHAFQNEVDIASPLWRDYQGRFNFYLPRCKMQSLELEFYSWTAQTEFSENSYGILEPNPLTSTLKTADSNTLILLPCLSVDQYGTRLGYGKGYYDRYCKQYPQALKMAVAYNLATQTIPKEAWDCRVDWVLTPTGLLATQ